MRASLRLLTARLPLLSPTGLAGILTHPHPRPALIALYNHTLSVLAELPSHSVYRQSAENLTRRRLSIISTVKPAGYEAFAEQRRQAGQPEQADIRDVAVYMRSLYEQVRATGKPGAAHAYADMELAHWVHIPWPEQAPTATEHVHDLHVELEPQLSAEQVEEIEARIGEGLIEEVLEVGWGELACAEAMREHQVWKPLEVVPDEGQWVAFERVPATGA